MFTVDVKQQINNNQQQRPLEDPVTTLNNLIQTSATFCDCGIGPLLSVHSPFTTTYGGGRVMRWFCLNFQCDDSRTRAYCAGSRCGWVFFGQFYSPLSLLSSLSSLSLWETARYRLKYCLKGPLNPKQPTSQPLDTENSIEAVFTEQS